MVRDNFHLSTPRVIGRLALPGVGAAILAGAIFLPPTLSRSAEPTVKLPAAVVDEGAPTASSETVVLAGGCFWGVQGVFQHLKGVTEAVSGYAGGATVKPSYEQVSTGTTGHAESVEVTFDPRVVSFGTILRVYFSVAHNPTELNYQGPDTGTQYRSEIFYTTPKQKEVAAAYIAQLDAAKAFAEPIVTRVEPFTSFYPAEGYHQNYATIHPEQPYIAYNDLPKIENLSRLYPDFYREKAKLVAVASDVN